MVESVETVELHPVQSYDPISAAVVAVVVVVDFDFQSHSFDWFLHSSEQDSIHSTPFSETWKMTATSKPPLKPRPTLYQDHSPIDPL